MYLACAADERDNRLSLGGVSRTFRAALCSPECACRSRKRQRRGRSERLTILRAASSTRVCVCFFRAQKKSGSYERKRWSEAQPASTARRRFAPNKRLLSVGFNQNSAVRTAELNRPRVGVARS